jgi:hypothetical protein
MNKTHFLMHWKARIDRKNKYRGYPTNNIGMDGYVDLGVRTQMDGGAVHLHHQQSYSKLQD